jgi:chitodextrinase
MSRRFPAPKKLLILTAALVSAAGLTGVAYSAQAAGPSLSASFSQSSIWSTGYGGGYTLTNTGTANTASWVLEFDLPAGTSVSSSWNSVLIKTGQHYKFTNASFNGTIKPGAAASFGFNAAGTGLPGQCTVNGVSCGGGTTPPPTTPTGPPSGDQQAPTTPGGLHATGATAGSVSLAWNASTDNVGVSDYQVLNGSADAATVASPSATITGLAPDTAYGFTVRARDAAGNVSAPSTSVSVTTGAGTGGGPTVNVATAAQLQAALAGASPGQTIQLAAGTYRGSFVATSAGTADKPITLTGPAGAVLINDGPSGSGPDCSAPAAGWDSGYGLWLYNAPYWNLTGFTVQESKKGIVVDNSPHTTIDGVDVNHTDEEGIHFRRSSADSVLRDSQVTYTGLVQPGYGEGVYIGSANSNWACYGNTAGVDRGDRVQILGNRIGPFVAAELIDVKEGTFGGTISGNTFDGQGVSGENSADSWIDVKGIGYTIADNTGTFALPGTFANGYENHNTSTTPSFDNGCGNLWRNNRSDLGGVGQYAIKISSVSKCAADPNVVYASNTVSNAVNGLTNITVTP